MSFTLHNDREVVVPIRVLILIFGLFASSLLHAGEATSIRWHENVSHAKQLPGNKTKPLLLYLTAPGCSYCVRMKNETFSHHDVSAKIQKKYAAVKVDARKHAQLARQLKIKLYPTTAIVHPNGTVVSVIPGYFGPRDFLKKLSSADQKLDYQTQLLAAKPGVAAIK